MRLSVSKGNSKMGSIVSVSLPPGITCRENAPCLKDNNGKTLCYVFNYFRRYPNVRDCYENNYKLLKEDPDLYFKEIGISMLTERFFRWHVSGDIPDEDYLERMAKVCRANKHCESLCFTKKYELVNEYKRKGKRIPKNLHIIFSGWNGLEMDNPYNFPEAHVRYKDGTTSAKEGALECGGNCIECVLAGACCWTLKNGEQVIFNEH